MHSFDRIPDTGYRNSIIGVTSPIIRPTFRVTGNVIPHALAKPTPCHGLLSAAGTRPTGWSQVINERRSNRISFQGREMMYGNNSSAPLMICSMCAIDARAIRGPPG